MTDEAERERLRQQTFESAAARYQQRRPEYPAALYDDLLAVTALPPGDQAWAALRPGGHLDVWAGGHVFPDDGDPIFDELQEVYDEIGAGEPEGAPRPRPGEMPPPRPTTSRPAGCSRWCTSGSSTGRPCTPPRSTST